MTNKETREALIKYKRLYNSTGRVVIRHEQTIKDLQAQLSTVHTNLTNCQTALDLQKTLNRQIGEEHNKKEQDLVTYMNRLKEKLREFGYADFNQLGD